jgi:hypothetical protein
MDLSSLTGTTNVTAREVPFRAFDVETKGDFTTV